jgi:hypothetical protein
MLQILNVRCGILNCLARFHEVEDDLVLGLGERLAITSHHQRFNHLLRLQVEQLVVLHRVVQNSGAYRTVDAPQRLLQRKDRSAHAHHTHVVHFLQFVERTLLVSASHTTHDGQRQ